MPRKRSKLGDGSPSQRPRKTKLKTPSNLEPRSAGPSANFSRRAPSDDKAMSAGPSTKFPHNTPSDVKAMVVNPLVPRSTGREFPNGALSAMVNALPRVLESGRWQDSGEDTAHDSILPQLFFAGIAAMKYYIDGCPQSLLSDAKQLQKNMNVAKNSDPEFVNLLRQAVKDNTEELWGCVLMHGIPPDPRWAALSTAHFQFIDVFHTDAQ
jgi:hypothetical protein